MLFFQGFRNVENAAPSTKSKFSLDMRCFLHYDEKFLHLWWKTGSKKKNISHSMTSQTNCSEHRMICSRFLSDYLEIFSAPPRKSLDNHSKTSHRSSCFPHSFFEVVEYENYYSMVKSTSTNKYLFYVTFHSFFQSVFSPNSIVTF